MANRKETNLYNIALNAMFEHEEAREYPKSGDDLIVWPDGESCNAEDLPGMTHKSDDYVRIAIDSNAYDVVACAMA